MLYTAEQTDASREDNDWLLEPQVRIPYYSPQPRRLRLRLRLSLRLSLRLRLRLGLSRSLSLSRSLTKP